jgi:hypothetical protein
MASQQVFQIWNDTVSEGFKNNCVEQIQRDWNSYLQEMNLRMNLFMRAEKAIDEEISKRIKNGFYDLSNENCIIKQGTMTSSITLNNNNKNKEESGYCCT